MGLVVLRGHEGLAHDDNDDDDDDDDWKKRFRDGFSVSGLTPGAKNACPILVIPPWHIHSCSTAQGKEKTNAPREARTPDLEGNSLTL